MMDVAKRTDDEVITELLDAVDDCHTLQTHFCSDKASGRILKAADAVREMKVEQYKNDRRFGEWCNKVVKDSAESPPVGFLFGDIVCPKCSMCDIGLRPHLDLAHCNDCNHTWSLHVVSVQEVEGGE